MKTVSVTVKELKKAADRWYEFHGLKSISMWHYLVYLGEHETAELLKSETGRWRFMDDYKVSAESARKIKLLNTDHYKTILAMYKAQNMIE